MYESPSKVGEGPKYHIGLRTSLSFNKMDVPGPGTYAPQFNFKQGASYSLKGKHKIGTQIILNADGGHEKMTPGTDLDVPGPGTYST